MELSEKQKVLKDGLRQRFRDGFDSSVREVVPMLTGKDIFDEMILKSAIASNYQAFKETLFIAEFAAIGWSPQDLLDEELQVALDKYL